MSLVETQRGLRRHSYLRRLTVLLVCLMAANTGALARSSRSVEHWVGTWATAPVARPQDAQSPPRRRCCGCPVEF